MLSVVIPTRDRWALLLETLRSFDAQSPPRAGAELVVADNNSGDDTPASIREFAAGSALPVKLADAPRDGPAQARNEGVAVAAGELIVFVGDDTAPAGPELLAAHERLHELNPDPRYAVQGRVTWNPDQAVTPFMRWLESSGVQFSFEGLEPGKVDPATAFCTAHVSMKRELFERAGGFDARFPDAAMEDVELGSRLRGLGLELDYRPELLVLHTHPTTARESLRRMERVGRSAALFHNLHPDGPWEGVGAPRGARWTWLRLTAPLWRLVAAAPLPGPLRRTAWRATHMAAYAAGYRQGPPPAAGAAAPSLPPGPRH